MSDSGKEGVVPTEEMHAFVVRCMMAVGTPQHHAAALADLLTAADHRGHYSHGLNRLGILGVQVQVCSVVVVVVVVCVCVCVFEREREGGGGGGGWREAPQYIDYVSVCQ